MHFFSNNLVTSIYFFFSTTFDFDFDFDDIYLSYLILFYLFYFAGKKKKFPDESAAAGGIVHRGAGRNMNITKLDRG